MESTHSQICTIGYQGRTIDEFIRLLLTHGVDVLVDVRRRALSRKPGFSKTKLREALEEVGVTYFHIPQLGMPADLMPKRNLHDNSEILSEYASQLSEHAKHIEQLRSEAENKRICLLCFEHDPSICHRHVLANRLAEESDFEVDHL